MVNGIENRLIPGAGKSRSYPLTPQGPDAGPPGIKFPISQSVNFLSVSISHSAVACTPTRLRDRNHGRLLVLRAHGLTALRNHLTT